MHDSHLKTAMKSRLKFVFCLIFFANKSTQILTDKLDVEENAELSDHGMVTNSKVFPYVAAILKKTQYLSAGALIDDLWVLTAADALFFLRETTRVLRVRLGSSNSKKGGLLIPVKYFEIHPYFDDRKPYYDIALVMLARPVMMSPSLNPIRMQQRPHDVAATHFIVTSWPNIPYQKPNGIESMEMVKRRRLLYVSHLHPTARENCTEQLDAMDIEDNGAVMCLDPAIGTDACTREVGAPVVLNGILWGIVSSWRPEDCATEPSSYFVSLVAAQNISTWVHAITHGHRWSQTQKIYPPDDYDYEDSYIGL